MMWYKVRMGLRFHDENEGMWKCVNRCVLDSQDINKIKYVFICYFQKIKIYYFKL